jgi:hypothetical protein
MLNDEMSTLSDLREPLYDSSETEEVDPWILVLRKAVADYSCSVCKYGV